MKNIHSLSLVGICSWGSIIWLHEYLISLTEISVNWSGSKQLWTRPIYTVFNGLFSCSCGLFSCSWSRISGHHEPIHAKFGVWRFFMLLKYGHKMLKRKKENLMMSHFSTLWMAKESWKTDIQGPNKHHFYMLICTLKLTKAQTVKCWQPRVSLHATIWEPLT